jgi:Fibronectin type III domain
MKRVGLVLVVLASSLGLGARNEAGAVSSWCSDGASAPCIESATRNGSTVTSSDPTWSLYTVPITPSASTEFLWGVSKNGDFQLGSAALTDDWVVTMDVGAEVPRVVFTHGTDVTVTRTADGDGTYHVTVAATPIVIVGECNQSVWPWTCPETATQEWDGYLDGQITDYGAWSDVDQRNSMYGMDYSTNVAATSLPPEIVNDPTTGAERLLVRLANPHFLEDGTTVFTGFAHQRIPNAFLHEVYAIDSPSTLTTSGLAPIVTGAGASTVTVTEDSGGGAMLVDATGLTFSARKLVVNRGIITPTRPRNVHARRLGPHSGRLRFDPATPRGSRITGYAARCVHNASVVTATGSGSPLTVSGLHQGVGYDCRVRAISKAGPGTLSALDYMPAHAG